jgi:hypothetical protein
VADDPGGEEVGAGELLLSGTQHVLYTFQ